MPDVLGYRAKVGVLIPSTNTIVEAEYNAIAPHGVTIHAGRMHVPRPSVNSDADTTTLLDDVRAGVPTAIRDVMTCEPDHLLMGMSAPTFYGGIAGMRAYEAQVSEQAGIAATSGAGAMLAALEALGARRIAVLSPYQPVNDEQVVAFFEEAGCAFTAYQALRSPSATAIAEVTDDQLRPLLAELAASKPDAVLQVGTNLAMARLADEAERWLGMPVVAINAATLWCGLRALGIDDAIRGFGCLLRDH